MAIVDEEYQIRDVATSRFGHEFSARPSVFFHAGKGEGSEGEVDINPAKLYTYADMKSLINQAKPLKGGEE
jgi:hypothetical protein